MRNGIVPSVIAVLLLAGCADSAPPDEGNAPVSVITDPRDLLNGTAPGSHIHDYWGGRESVKVLESSDGPNSASCTDCAEGMRFNTERPAEGAIVPQGTAWVNGTFTLESDGRDQYGAIELWVKTAQDSEPWLWGEIRSGEQFSIPSSQERNDPPHYVLSLWEFELHTIGATDMHIGGTYHWNIDAVRGLQLLPYPPHPNRWGDATELDLLSATGSTNLTYQVDLPAYGTEIFCTGSCPWTHRLNDGAVVPHDTSRIEATLTLSGGVPAGLGLWFHAADTWEQTKAEGAPASPGRIVYTIPIEGSMADSPYAPQSLWEFEVWLDQPQQPVQAWSGEYTLTIRALRD